VSTRVLIDAGLARSRVSRVILAAAVLDDVVGIVILTAVLAVTGAGGPGPSLAGVALRIGAFLLIGIPLAHALLPRVHALTRRWFGGEAGFALAFSGMLLFAWLASASGLEPILGAFFAGLALTRSPFARDVESELAPFIRVLAPVFFVSIGIALDPAALLQNLGVALLLSAGAVASKILGCGLPARAAGLGWRESVVIGVGMVPRGEVGLIIAGLGHAVGALDAQLFSAAAFVCVATILVVPPVLRLLTRGWQGDGAATGVRGQAV
jgi:Kef-type K+ transport system membrane component KefB